MDTLGPAVLSTIERLSSSRRSKDVRNITMKTDRFGIVSTVLSRDAVLFLEGPLSRGSTILVDICIITLTHLCLLRN